MNDQFAGNTAPGISVSKNSNPYISTTLLWITFAVVVLATVFLYLQSRATQNAVLDKEATKDEIVSQLSSPSYVAVEQKANGFKEAYNILAKISGTEMPKKELLNELYTYFTKDVFIRNLSLSADGSMVLDGETASYRAVADFMTALKSYKRISAVSLANVSLSSGEGVATNKSVSFSVSCKIDTAKKDVAKEKSSQSSDNSSEYFESNNSDYDSELDPMDTYN